MVTGCVLNVVFTQILQEVFVMKKILIAVVALLMLGSFSSAQAGANIRAGGGMIFDGSILGGGAAVDITLGEDMPIAISPFVEYYRDKDDILGTSFTSTLIPFGVNVLYMKSTSEKLDVYAGAGGGLLRLSVDAGGTSESQNRIMATAVAGATFKMTEQMGIFVEGKSILSWKGDTDSTRDLAAFIGLSFSLGGE